MLSLFLCATKLVSSTKYKKECGKMSTEELNRTEKIDYAKKVLKQYKSNSYLADLGIKPNLTADGTISNLSEFLEIKDKTKNPLSCDTPLEKIARSEEHTSELQSRGHLVCRLLLEKKKNKNKPQQKNKKKK